MSENVVRLIIVAVGGQGNLLTAKVLGEACLASGVEVRMSEIHGMAQRGGVVESAIIMGPAQSTVISDGQADVLVGFEPAETLRAIRRAHKDTLVITNTSPLPPFTAAIGKGVYPDLDNVLDLLRQKTAKVIAFDAMALAREAENPLSLNMVLLGALVATDKVPVKAEAVRKAIADTTKKDFVARNQKAFDLGFEAARDA
ncbi:MAG: indolepyruvate oxidoreductase subunit beta [Desulfatibacillaceae bacterium]